MIHVGFLQRSAHQAGVLLAVQSIRGHKFATKALQQFVILFVSSWRCTALRDIYKNAWWVEKFRHCCIDRAFLLLSISICTFLSLSALEGKFPSAIWIMKHKEMSKSSTILLAIQTLRNTMMAAVFFGGNAINFAYEQANEYSTLKERLLQVRSLVIMTLMFSSFLCWVNVIRLCSVLGYLIGTMQSESCGPKQSSRIVFWHHKEICTQKQQSWLHH